MFDGVFKRSLLLMQDLFNYQVNRCNDCYSLLFVMLLNKQNQKVASERGAASLNPYFSQIEAILWPRLHALFDAHMKSVQKMNIKSFMLLESQLETGVLLQRYVDFALALYRINELDGHSNQMLNIRLGLLRDTLMRLLINVAKFKGKRGSQAMYLVVCLEYLAGHLAEHQHVKKADLDFFAKEKQQYQDSFVELSLRDKFPDLVDFVQKYAQKEQQSQELKGELASGAHAEPGQPLPVNKPLIESVNQNFCYGWQVSIQKQVEYCRKYLAGTDSLKIVLKKFLTNLLSFYNAFYLYVQGNHGAYVSKLKGVAIIMKEINKHLSNVS
jgi:hypothetical protein